MFLFQYFLIYLLDCLGISTFKYSLKLLLIQSLITKNFKLSISPSNVIKLKVCSESYARDNSFLMKKCNSYCGLKPFITKNTSGLSARTQGLFEICVIILSPM